MKIRSLALVLAVGFALTSVAEAKKRPVYSASARKGSKARKSTVSKYKPAKRKVSKYRAKPVKHRA
jgi:hypothetical protein